MKSEEPKAENKAETKEEKAETKEAVKPNEAAVKNDQPVNTNNDQPAASDEKKQESSESSAPTAPKTEPESKAVPAIPAATTEESKTDPAAGSESAPALKAESESKEAVAAKESDAPEKFAREKAILDKCIADLEAECAVEMADSCDNTAMGSDEGSSNGKSDLVSYLFSFVDVEPGIELNELLAGYFKRAVLALISGKPKEMAEFFENNTSVIQNLFVHSTNKSVSEVLCKALSIDDTYVSNPIQFTQVRNEILHGILTRLENPIADQYSLDQIAQTFCDLADQTKEIPALCCCLEVLRKLISLSLEKNHGVAASALKILTKLLSMDKSPVVTHLKDQLTALSLVRPSAEDEAESEGEELLKLINEQLVYFKEVLQEDKEGTENQFRVTVKPFGVQRLKIIEYIHTLIKLIIYPIIDQMYHLQLQKLLCDLFVRFPFNSVLHSLVYSVFKTVFDSDSKSLLHVFALNKDFVTFLVESSVDPFYTQPNGRKVRKPYVGYITKLANHLVKLTDNVEVAKYLHDNTSWTEYCKTTLTEENERNETALGGRRATTENEGEENVNQEEQNLIFEGNLASVFKKLKEVSFESILQAAEVQVQVTESKEEEAKKPAEEDDEAKKTAQEEDKKKEEAAAEPKKKEEEEAAAAKAKQEEEATTKAKQEEEATTKAKQEKEATVTVKQEEETAVKAKQEEETTTKAKQEQEAAVTVKQEEAAMKAKQEEQAAAAKAKEEQAAAAKEEEAATKAKQEEAAAAKQEEAATKAKQEGQEANTNTVAADSSIITKEVNPEDKYLDSEYWRKNYLYNIESLAADFE